MFFWFITPKNSGKLRKESRLSAEVAVMKVNGTGGLFYGYYTSGLAGKKGGVSSPLSHDAKSDQVTLSKQVLAVVQAQNRLRAMEQARKDAENSPEAQALDSMQKTMKIMKICSKIAARRFLGIFSLHRNRADMISCFLSFKSSAPSKRKQGIFFLI